MFHAPLQEDTDLKILEARHAEELFALADAYRDDLRRWLAWVDTTRSADDYRAYIERRLRQFADGEGLFAGIWHEGRIAGAVSIDWVRWEDRTASLGYWLGTEFQGRGLATLAARAMADHCFYELGLNRVAIHCAAGNRPSRDVAERLGFQEEGTLRQALRLRGDYIDIVVYGMLAHEWRAGKG